MTRGENFIKNAKCTQGHRSTMSNSAWSDLNKNCTVLKLHDMCHDPKCKCQKQITFSPNQFQLEAAGFTNTTKKKHKGSQTAWNKFLKAGGQCSGPINRYGCFCKNKKSKSWTSNGQYTQEYIGK